LGLPIGNVLSKTDSITTFLMSRKDTKRLPKFQKAFFLFLETQNHISIQVLSRYRLYLPCPKGTAGGYRLYRG
jgi:hypothetical protein